LEKTDYRQKILHATNVDGRVCELDAILDTVKMKKSGRS
jgi:hypothetical protein